MEQVKHVANGRTRAPATGQGRPSANGNGHSNGNGNSNGNGHSNGNGNGHGSPAELDRLVRELVTQARSLQVAPEESVIMDVETDDVRVLLVDHRRGRAHASLTPREREIAYLVAEGLSNKRIAARLGISSDTVSTHLRRIFAKLGVTTRSAMVGFLFEVELQLTRGAA